MNVLKRLNPKNTKAAKNATYVIACGVLKTIVKMADQEGMTDIHQVNDWIQSLTADDFCYYKFIEAPDPDLSEVE